MNKKYREDSTKRYALYFLIASIIFYIAMLGVFSWGDIQKDKSLFMTCLEYMASFVFIIIPFSAALIVTLFSKKHKKLLGFCCAFIGPVLLSIFMCINYLAGFPITYGGQGIIIFFFATLFISFLPTIAGIVFGFHILKRRGLCSPMKE